GDVGGSWSSSDPSVATVNNSGVVTAVSEGNSTIIYTVTNDCGSDSATHEITVHPPPNISAGPDQSICEEASVSLSGSGVGTGGSYTWDNGVTDGTAFAPSVGTTTYTVTGTDANGCENTDQVDV